MSNSELLKILERARQEKLARLNAKPARQPPASKPPVNWEDRRMRKNKLFLRWLGVLGAMVGFSLFCVVLPLLVAHPPLGKTVLLAIPPNLFVALSWMAGAWYTYDKNRQLGMVLTVGMMPVRLAFFIAWFWLVSFVPGVNVAVLVVTMMVFWGLFTVPEIAMLTSFTNNLQRTSELEPDEEAGARPKPQ
jgi:hypothetical protein